MARRPLKGGGTDAAPPAPHEGEDRKRLKAMGAIAKRMAGGWEPAATALTRVRAVPTIFRSVNLATRVGGWPIERCTLVHGPSNHGKSLFVHGLGLSFLQRGHFYAYVDAEFTTSHAWVTELMGELADHPGFIAQRPKTYEQTVDAVRSLVETIADARAKKELPPDTTALVVVDSIAKLVPQRLREAIEKKGAASAKGSVDGMSGRAAMYKAALNAQWLHELVPLLYHTRTGLVFIGREIENEQAAGTHARPWKLTGGKAPYFDSSLVVRVARAGWVKQGSGDDAKAIGERHSCTIHKTKVGGKDGKAEVAYFHSTLGERSTFDLARDCLDLGRQLGLAKKSGAAVTWLDTGETWRSENEAARELAGSASLSVMMEQLDAAVAAKLEGE